MSITPLPRFNKFNWIESHNNHCRNITTSNPSTLLIGDSIIAGLSRYKNVWKKYFQPFNTVNCGIGGDKVQNVLWRCNNFPPSLSVKNIVVMCGTNNIQHDSVEDITGGIIDISSQLRRIYKNSNVIVCGLLPRDESWSVNRVYIKELNEYLHHKCNFIGVTFIDQIDWTSQNGSLKSNLYYDDNLHLIEEGNAKLAALIYKHINPPVCNNNSVSVATKLFPRNIDFYLSDEDFPPIQHNTALKKISDDRIVKYVNKSICNPVRSVCKSTVSKRVSGNVHVSKPVKNSLISCNTSSNGNYVSKSKHVTVKRSCQRKPVYDNYVRPKNTVSGSNVCLNKSVKVSITRTSKNVCSGYVRTNSSVNGRSIRPSKPFSNGSVQLSKSVSKSIVCPSKPVSACIKSQRKTVNVPLRSSNTVSVCPTRPRNVNENIIDIIIFVDSTLSMVSSLLRYTVLKSFRFLIYVFTIFCLLTILYNNIFHSFINYDSFLHKHLYYMSKTTVFMAADNLGQLGNISVSTTSVSTTSSNANPNFKLLTSYVVISILSCLFYKKRNSNLAKQIFYCLIFVSLFPWKHTLQI